MPNIRILNWNIEKLSYKKTQIAGMADNIARVIVDANADIVILLELTSKNPIGAINAISQAANNIAGGNDYLGWFLSHPSGEELYGVLIKDMNTVRPVIVSTGPSGTSNNELGNLDLNTFSTWPSSFLPPAGNANAYPLPRGARPELPLIGPYASDKRARGASGGARRTFGGKNSSEGGYSMGRGFRLPFLAMFEVLNGTNNGTYLLPIVACHLGAVRSGRNTLGLQQFKQYKELHIAQKFLNPGGAAHPKAIWLPKGGYIALNGAVKAVQDLMYTGDFNIDFLEQSPPLPAANVAKKNRESLNTLTPTTTRGGSGPPTAAVQPVPTAPTALPGQPNPYSPVNPYPPGPPPGLPFNVLPPGPPGPGFHLLSNLALKTADTTQGTILHRYHAGIVPANLAALRGACFDNFFFGGAHLSIYFQTLTSTPPPAVDDAAEVVDVPAQIVQNGLTQAGQLNVAGAWAHYNTKGTKDAAAAVGFAPGAALPLSTNDQLIGARFISDHLPIIVQVNLP